MIRKIIRIDSEKCNGCGECAAACHEGAIGLENGKAVLLRDDYCDGLGNCLPVCRAGAISFEEREALAYDEAAVLDKRKAEGAGGRISCPGMMPGAPPLWPDNREGAGQSRLRQWPVQIRLVSARSAFLNDADLLIAADCCAYAYGDFHNTFMRGKVTLIGCPKLDAVSYADRLTEILKQNAVKSVTVARMSVPCCAGIEFAVKSALKESQKDLPLTVRVILPHGALEAEPASRLGPY